MNIDSANLTNSYLDFSGLGELRGRAAKDGQGAMRETAQQFEALFIQMMMKSMREATFKSDMLQSDALDTYQDMFDKEVSVSMAARGNMGLADMLTQQLGKAQTQTQASASAAHTLDAQPMPLKPADKALPLTGSSGKALPLSGYAVDKPMAVPSHWRRDTPAADRPLNNAGDDYADVGDAL